MNKYMYGFGTLALSLALGGVPAAAFAEDAGGDGQGSAAVQSQVTAQVQGVGISARTDGEVQSEPAQQGERPQQGEVRGQANKPAIVGSNEEENVEASTTRESEQEGFHLKLEGTTTQAFSFEQLKQSIEQRKQELDQEEASTTPGNQDIMKNANPVRLAVHSFLASKDLLGGIGQQVSDIAKQMNDSVATTTDAEVKIQSRGFFTKLFFGGDTAAATTIKDEVAQNQQRIDDLTKLLAQANVSADVQVTLKAQIAALQDAQTHLQDLAQKEQSTWGIFSWRF